MSHALPQVLAGICSVTRKEILRDFRADSCISTTRAVTRVLRHFGFEAIPLSVRVIVYNPIMVEAILTGTSKNSDDPDFHEWCKRTGAWSVGVGIPNGKPGLEGHLIAALPQQKVFIDASLDQAGRPEHNIVLPTTFVANVTDEFLTQHEAILEFECNTGVRMVYQRWETSAWRKSPDWTDKNRTKRAVKATIQHIKAGKMR